MPRLEVATVIAAPPESCFRLSLSIDAHTASMAGAGETVVGSTGRDVLGPGDTVTWRARHFGSGSG